MRFSSILFARSETVRLRHNQLQDEWPYLHYARFTGVDNALIWVHNYDIYYRQEVRATHAYRVSQDAVPGVVYNGIPDWLYEGEFRNIEGYKRYTYF